LNVGISADGQKIRLQNSKIKPLLTIGFPKVDKVELFAVYPPCYLPSSTLPKGYHTFTTSL
jgi:hypothetical protein